ncbi:MAG: hypothetical protein D3914_06295 [Candidatus Electrothrix sp. LOE2]|nr:hypothetical protein [Candidatus Electrothrix sp. LOE2]
MVLPPFSATVVFVRMRLRRTRLLVLHNKYTAFIKSCTIFSDAEHAEIGMMHTGIDVIPIGIALIHIDFDPIPIDFALIPIGIGSMSTGIALMSIDIGPFSIGIGLIPV